MWLQSSLVFVLICCGHGMALSDIILCESIHVQQNSKANLWVANWQYQTSSWISEAAFSLSLMSMWFIRVITHSYSLVYSFSPLIVFCLVLTITCILQYNCILRLHSTIDGHLTCLQFGATPSHQLAASFCDALNLGQGREPASPRIHYYSVFPLCSLPCTSLGGTTTFTVPHTFCFVYN